jgi:hypothetical protein
MNLHEEVGKGARAEQFLKSDVYQEAFNKVRQGILERWSSSPVGDKEGQHELRLMLKCLEDMHLNIVSVVNSGKLASLQIEEEKKRKTMMERAREGIHRIVG